MNSKATCLLRNLLILLVLSSASPAFSQSGDPWTAKDLKDPAKLAAALNDPKAAKPVILNVGPVQQIKGAVAIGPASVPSNFDKLKQELAKLPKDKEIVIYCGCCPFQRCPNVRPAFELLKQTKFTNAKLLNLPTSLEENWISKGYPVE
jgi:thiosulfate/3-mercaptopyruvate sulfurtransferase